MHTQIELVFMRVRQVGASASAYDCDAMVLEHLAIEFFSFAIKRTRSLIHDDPFGARKYSSGDI